MVMQTIRIQMSGDNHLKSVAPHTLGKFHPDLMSLLWRDLALLEALVAVIADNLTLILPLPFRYHHFVPCGGRLTVDACDKKLLLRFFSVGSVLHHIT